MKIADNANHVSRSL